MHLFTPPLGVFQKEVNVFNLGRQSRDVNDQMFEVNSIKNLTSEHEESMEIESEAKFDLEAEDFNLDQIVDSAVDWASSPSVTNPMIEIPILPSNEFTL